MQLNAVYTQATEPCVCELQEPERSRLRSQREASKSCFRIPSAASSNWGKNKLDLVRHLLVVREYINKQDSVNIILTPKVVSL